MRHRRTTSQSVNGTPVVAGPDVVQETFGATPKVRASKKRVHHNGISGPFDNYTVHDLRLSKVALCFASKEVEHWYQLSKTLRALPVATSLTTLFTLRNLHHTSETWNRPDASSIELWCAAIQSSLNIMVMVALLVMFAWSQVPDKRREALRWGLARLYRVAVVVQIAADIWGAAFFSGIGAQ